MVGHGRTSHGGAVYCEVDGVATELLGEHLRQEGLFVPTPEPLAVDREVELFLRSPAGQIVLRGLVVQVIGCAEAAAQRRSPGYGVLFLDLRDEQRAWITRTRAALEAQRPSPAPSPTPSRAPTPMPSRVPTPMPSRAPTPMPSRAPAPIPTRTSTPSRAPTRAASTPSPAKSTPSPAKSTPSPAKSTPSPAKSTPRIEDAVERARAARKVGSATLRTSTLAQLEAELAALKARSPSEILGLAAPQDVEAAHRAFLTLSKRYHPHVFARFDSAEVTRLATEIFIVYKRAYATLRSGGKDGGAQRAPGSDAPRPSSPPPPAARNAASMAPGPSSLRAPPPLRTSLNPSGDPTARRVADAELLLASGLRHLAASRFERAEIDLVKASRLAPERTDIAIWRHIGCARTHKAGGRPEEAATSYRKVLELDPQHREAREHLEPPAERRRGGLMSKWLGRGGED